MEVDLLGIKDLPHLQSNQSISGWQSTRLWLILFRIELGKPHLNSALDRAISITAGMPKIKVTREQIAPARANPHNLRLMAKTPPTMATMPNKAMNHPTGLPGLVKPVMSSITPAIILKTPPIAGRFVDSPSDSSV